MFDAIRSIIAVDELRRRCALTLVLLFVYRMGFWLPLPFVDQLAVRASSGDSGGLSDLFRVAAMFAASDLGTATIFGLGVMPYITASIVFQLLGQVYPPLEALQKDGDQGRRKINEFTRIATVFVALIQSYWWLVIFGSGGGGLLLGEFSGPGWLLSGAIIVSCGTCVLMWVSEQIDGFGVGNGISLLIVAGIVARVGPSIVGVRLSILTGVSIGGEFGVERILLLGLIVGLVIAMIVSLTQSQRRIPLRSTRLGQRSLSGQHYLPLRMAQAGVMPVIFASSVLLLPAFVFRQASGFGYSILSLLSEVVSNPSNLVHQLLYIGFIFFFSYFWVALSFNPKQIADGMRDQSVFIPGYRPGRATEVYLESVMARLTFVGGAFLSLLAIMPQMCMSLFGFSNSAASVCGGTGMLIVVSVVLDGVRRIDSVLMARGAKCVLADGDN